MKDYLIWIGEKLQKKYPHIKWETICEAILDYKHPLTAEYGNGEYSIERYLREVKNG